MSAAKGENIKLVKYITQTLKVKSTELVIDPGIESNNLEVVTSLIEDSNIGLHVIMLAIHPFARIKKLPRI